jgi:ribose transport system substrate-binding protein
VSARTAAGLSLFGVFLAATLSCGRPEHAVEENYILLATNINLPYWQNAAAGLRRAASELKVKAEFLGPESYDPKAQREELDRALQQRQKPTGILVSAADAALMKPAIDSAIAQGIPVITIDSDAPDSKRLFFIGTDNYKAGTMGARVVAEQLRGKGNVIVYTIPEQQNLKERLHGYEAVFETHPQLKITQVIDVKGDPRIAFDRTMEMFEKNTAGSKADAYVCLLSSAGPEVAEVLDRKKVSGKLVVAMDTDRRTLEWIQKGVISATVGQKPFTMAYVGVKALDDLHHHKLQTLEGNWARQTTSPVPAFIDTGAVMIDKSNVEAYLQEQSAAAKK